MENVIMQLNRYKTELEDISKELEILPEGYLVKRKTTYLQRIGAREFGITKKPEIIRMLCRKRYLLVREEQLKNNISLLSSTPDKIDFAKPEELITKMPQAYQNLPVEYFHHPKIQSWLAQSQQKNTFPLSGGSYHSQKGIALRSKSELIIANLLEKYNLPYHYDTALNFTEKTIYPDFKIKNPYTNKLVIWEHFGALNQPDYERKMNDKMNTYLSHGYTSENLIYTFEFHIKKEQRLKKMIETIIL